ncbi:hypothetical protein CMV_017249 [Castanea mollissima]|uniref:Uncharacterized protein n=1 Tax=Castanea mollissima TaxID=60419 RepID=A0A8J4QRA6_9ROSI|nr:hypothetical protein CMV_017249 [Castanea mollissima]
MLLTSYDLRRKMIHARSGGGSNTKNESVQAMEVSHSREVHTRSDLTSINLSMGSYLAAIVIMLSNTPVFSIGVSNYSLQTRHIESTHGCPIQ